MSINNESKTILITGGNNGLGYYLGRSLLNEGNKVAIIDLSIDNAKKLKSKFPSRLLNYICDVRKEDEIKKSIDNIIDKWGKIDVLVNNAALAIFKTFDEKTIDETMDEFAVNYFGYVKMIKYVVPHMKKQKNGIIHNVSSAVGITGFKGIYGYSSTKGAIESLTKTLAIELEQYNIQVSLIHPPLMNTISAAPLGIPTQVMEDPEVVGKKLAKRLFLNKSVITPDIKTSIFLKMSYLFPEKIGKFLSKATEKEREKE